MEKFVKYISIYTKPVKTPILGRTIANKLQTETVSERCA